MYNINVKIFVDISIKTNITHALQSKCIKCIKMYKLNFNSFIFLPCNNNQCKYLFNLAFFFLHPYMHTHALKSLLMTDYVENIKGMKNASSRTFNICFKYIHCHELIYPPYFLY